MTHWHSNTPWHTGIATHHGTLTATHHNWHSHTPWHWHSHTHWHTGTVTHHDTLTQPHIMTLWHSHSPWTTKHAKSRHLHIHHALTQRLKHVHKQAKSTAVQSANAERFSTPSFTVTVTLQKWLLSWTLSGQIIDFSVKAVKCKDVKIYRNFHIADWIDFFSNQLNISWCSLY